MSILLQNVLYVWKTYNLMRRHFQLSAGTLFTVTQGQIKKALSMFDLDIILAKNQSIHLAPFFYVV